MSGICWKNLYTRNYQPIEELGEDMKPPRLTLLLVASVCLLGAFERAEGEECLFTNVYIGSDVERRFKSIVYVPPHDDQLRESVVSVNYKRAAICKRDGPNNCHWIPINSRGQ